ncbi:uncharacterized protein [Diadema setosum]|uniref:uncharacterized protein n=1 Tax=Diadema setosum TaxID=31175 RepID=UPI003B3A48F1
MVVIFAAVVLSGVVARNTRKTLSRIESFVTNRHSKDSETVSHSPLHSPNQLITSPEDPDTTAITSEGTLDSSSTNAIKLIQGSTCSDEQFSSEDFFDCPEVVPDVTVAKSRSGFCQEDVDQNEHCPCTVENLPVTETSAQITTSRKQARNYESTPTKCIPIASVPTVISSNCASEQLEVTQDKPQGRHQEQEGQNLQISRPEDDKHASARQILSNHNSRRTSLHHRPRFVSLKEEIESAQNNVEIESPHFTNECGPKDPGTPDSDANDTLESSNEANSSSEKSDVSSPSSHTADKVEDESRRDNFILATERERLTTTQDRSQSSHESAKGDLALPANELTEISQSVRGPISSDTIDHTKNSPRKGDFDDEIPNDSSNASETLSYSGDSVGCLMKQSTPTRITLSEIMSATGDYSNKHEKRDSVKGDNFLDVKTVTDRRTMVEADIRDNQSHHNDIDSVTARWFLPDQDSTNGQDEDDEDDTATANDEATEISMILEADTIFTTSAATAHQPDVVHTNTPEEDLKTEAEAAVPADEEGNMVESKFSSSKQMAYAVDPRKQHLFEDISTAFDDAAMKYAEGRLQIKFLTTPLVPDWFFEFEATRATVLELEGTPVLQNEECHEKLVECAQQEEKVQANSESVYNFDFSSPPVNSEHLAAPEPAHILSQECLNEKYNVFADTQNVDEKYTDIAYTDTSNSEGVDSHFDSDKFKRTAAPINRSFLDDVVVMPARTGKHNKAVRRKRQTRIAKATVELVQASEDLREAESRLHESLKMMEKAKVDCEGSEQDVEEEENLFRETLLHYSRMEGDTRSLESRCRAVENDLRALKRREWKTDIMLRATAGEIKLLDHRIEKERKVQMEQCNSRLQEKQRQYRNTALKVNVLVVIALLQVVFLVIIALWRV